MIWTPHVCLHPICPFFDEGFSINQSHAHASLSDCISHFNLTCISIFIPSICLAMYTKHRQWHPISHHISNDERSADHRVKRAVLSDTGSSPAENCIFLYCVLLRPVTRLGGLSLQAEQSLRASLNSGQRARSAFSPLALTWLDQDDQPAISGGAKAT